MRDGFSFATDLLLNHPCDRSLFMQTLAKLSVDTQQEIIYGCINEIKRSVVLSNELEQWLFLKIELLRLEQAKNKLTNGYLEPLSDEKREAVRVLEELLTSLNNAYGIAVHGDSTLQQKQSALDEVRWLLNSIETRNVLNSHRGIKKIVINIALAFAGLGIGYLIGCLVNYHATKGKNLVLYTIEWFVHYKRIIKH